ncbi:MAG TPA: metal ABC transporter permease [Nitrospiria bacterium]|jgi:ABC-type Mn2+/Zn2+ transport system permease subunit
MMLEILSIPFMRQAIFASSILTFMLAYLGIHVVKRRIVFVDLAIAQLSAVGVAFAMLFDFNPLVFSLVFTLVGAGLLSIPEYEKRIPQEAIMGIIYAVASAIAVLLIANIPHGEADILNLFFGNILGVTTQQLFVLLVVFGFVTFIHILFSKKFIQITETSTVDPSNKSHKRFWNLIFYLTLALVIAVAIRTAGVLLVFSTLVIPAVTALLFFQRFSHLVLTALGIGLIATWTGFISSFQFDLPTGPTIVTALGGWLFFASLVKTSIKFFKKKKP